MFSSVLNFACIGAEVAGSACPEDLSTALEAADAILSTGQVARAYGELSKLTQFAQRTIGKTSFEISSGNVRTVLGAFSKDAQGLTNDVRFARGLDPISDSGQPLTNITRNGKTIEAPSLEVVPSGRGDDILAPASPLNSRTKYDPSIGARLNQSPCLAASFTPDTLVRAADGKWKPIGPIMIGDRLSGLSDDGIEASTVVTGTRGRIANDRRDVKIWNVNGPFTIQTTADHLFRTPSGWLRADDLQPGTQLITSGSPSSVIQVEAIANTAPVISLSASPFPVFYVGTETVGGVLVHNAGACPIVALQEAIARQSVLGNPSRISPASIRVSRHLNGAIAEELARCQGSVTKIV
jgi:Pretoxin HINT domain